jgi:hypothetical protein
MVDREMDCGDAKVVSHIAFYYKAILSGAQWWNQRIIIPSERLRAGGMAHVIEHLPSK